jgi:hypothetical protein
MLRRITRTLTLGGAFVAAAIVATPSQAIPAFARQTGKACLTCHFQHFPLLNDYGQDFKAGGFVDMGKEGLVKGKELSLPEILNASIFVNTVYTKTNGTDTAGTSTAASGSLEFPQEAAILFGGRVNDNVGFFLEASLTGGGPTNPAILANFKIPFMYKVGDFRTGVVPFTTDGMGPAFGFELLSTGAVSNMRTLDFAEAGSAQQYINTGAAATGASFVLQHPQFFVNFSRWSPNHIGGNAGGFSRAPTSNYLRAAWTPTFGDWNLGLGFQSWSGSSYQLDNTGVSPQTLLVETKATAIDFQAQGAVGPYPLGVYLTHAYVPAPSAGTTNLFSSDPSGGAVTEKRKATILAGELGIIPNKVTLTLALRNATTGIAGETKDDATTFGARYNYAQNVAFRLEYTKGKKDTAGDGRFDGAGDTKTALIMSTAF